MLCTRLIPCSLAPLLPLFPLIHLLGTLLAVIGSVYLVSRLLVNWPFVPLFSPCGPQPKIPTPRGFPDPNMHLIRTTLRTQPKCSLTVLAISQCPGEVVFYLCPGDLPTVLVQWQVETYYYYSNYLFLVLYKYVTIYILGIVDGAHKK